MKTSSFFLRLARGFFPLPFIVPLALAMAFFAPATTLAQSFTWWGDGATGEWTTGTWYGGSEHGGPTATVGALPTAVTNVRMQNGLILITNDLTPTANGFIIGHSANTSGTVWVGAGGALSTAGGMNVATSGTGLLKITDDGLVTNMGAVALAHSGGAEGFVEVGGSGKWVVENTLTVGNSGSGQLDIGEFGTVTTKSTLTIGSQVGSQGSMNLSGSAQLATGTGLTNNAHSGAILGSASNTFATAIVGGSAVWNNHQRLLVGSYGTGTLILQDQAKLVTDWYTYIGEQAGSRGVVTLGSSAQWTVAQQVIVGSAGTGELTVSGSAQLTGTASLIIGNSVNTGIGTVTFTGTGQWNMGSSITVGNNGVGTLSITGQRGITATSLTIGNTAGSSGTFALGGSATLGTTATGDRSICIGYSGAGEATVSGDARLDTLGYIELASTATSTGTLDIRDRAIVSSSNTFIIARNGTAAVTMGSSAQLTVGAHLYLGLSGTSAATLTVTGSAQVVSTNASGQLLIGNGVASTGTVTLSGSGTWALGGNITVAGGSNSQGLLDIGGQRSVSTKTALLIGNTTGASGTVLLGGSALLTTGLSYSLAQNTEAASVGYAASSTGKVSLDSGTRWENNGNINVGYNGTGTITIAGRAVLSQTGNMYIGRNLPATGSVTVSGSGQLNSTGGVTVGDSGTGTLTIKDTAQLATGALTVGNRVSSGTLSKGTVDVSGTGQWLVGGDITVGNSGIGTLTVDGQRNITNSTKIILGGVSGASGTITLGGHAVLTTGTNYALNADGNASIGNAAGGKGHVAVGGSAQWVNTGNLYVGSSGYGSLLVKENGKVSVNTTTTSYIGKGSGGGSVTVRDSGELSFGGNFTVGNSSSGTLAIQGGKVSNNDGQLTYNGASIATVSGSGWWENRGKLTVGNGTVGGTLAIMESGSVSVGAAYTQTLQSTLKIDLAEGRTSAYLTASSANLNKSTLEIGGLENIAAAKSSELSTARALVLSAAAGTITNSFATLRQAANTVDYLTVHTGTLIDNKDYYVTAQLSWNVQDAATNGSFTIKSGTFEVNQSLANNTTVTEAAANAGSWEGWDGKSLTKAGAGTLVLSAENTFSGDLTVEAGTLVLGAANGIEGAVAVNGGTLQVLDAAALGGRSASGLSVAAGATLDLFGPDGGSAGDGTGILRMKGEVAILGTINFTLGGNLLEDDDDPTAKTSGTLRGLEETLTLDGATIHLNNLDFGIIIDYAASYRLFSTFDFDAAAASYIITGYDSLHYSAALDNDGYLRFTLTQVPEPGTWALMLGGLGALALLRRRAGGGR